MAFYEGLSFEFLFGFVLDPYVIRKYNINKKRTDVLTDNLIYFIYIKGNAKEVRLC